MRLGRDLSRRLSVHRSVLVLLAVALATACVPGAGDQIAYIDLDERQHLEGDEDDHQQPLRIGVAAVLSAEANLASYSGLADYLGEQFGLRAELVQRRTYSELNDLVAAGDIDLAFVCTSAYIRGSEAGTMHLLVVPEIDQGSTYRSFIIVPESSVAQQMEDLRGSVFAFTDPMSLTGRAYPVSRVYALGEPVDGFFARTVFTYSHEDAVRAVADGVVDGAGVHELVLDHIIAREPEIAEMLRVIDRSPGYGIPPVVVPSTTTEAMRSRLLDLLVGLTTHDKGREILTDLGVDRFVVPDRDLYDSARSLMRAHGDAP